MDMLSLREEILQLIALRQEGEYWDFKKEWYKRKPDLLHDIICMANNLSNHDGLIIIGVDEETDYSICNVANDQNRRKTQDIVAFLREKKFAGGIRPTVYVQSLSLNQTTIGAIVIRTEMLRWHQTLYVFLFNKSIYIMKNAERADFFRYRPVSLQIIFSCFYLHEK